MECKQGRRKMVSFLHTNSSALNLLIEYDIGCFVLDFAIPNETRFPLPPLRTLLEFLQEDAKAEAKGKHKHHVCSSVCEEHGTPWNKALANLSQTCHYFHDECSLVRFAKVVVKRDDTLEELERFIKPEYRSAIKSVPFRSKMSFGNAECRRWKRTECSASPPPAPPPLTRYSQDYRSHEGSAWT